MYCPSTLWTPGDTWMLGDKRSSSRAPNSAVSALGWQKFAVKLSRGLRKAPWRWKPEKNARLGSRSQST